MNINKEIYNDYITRLQKNKILEKFGFYGYNFLSYSDALKIFIESGIKEARKISIVTIICIFLFICAYIFKIFFEINYFFIYPYIFIIITSIIYLLYSIFFIFNLLNTVRIINKYEIIIQLENNYIVRINNFNKNVMFLFFLGNKFDKKYINNFSFFGKNKTLFGFFKSICKNFLKKNKFRKISFGNIFYNIYNFIFIIIGFFVISFVFIISNAIIIPGISILNIFNKGYIFRKIGEYIENIYYEINFFKENIIFLKDYSKSIKNINIYSKKILILILIEKIPQKINDKNIDSKEKIVYFLKNKMENIFSEINKILEENIFRTEEKLKEIKGKDEFITLEKRLVLLLNSLKTQKENNEKFLEKFKF